MSLCILEAVRSGDTGRIQGVINTGFGELFRHGATQSRQPEELSGKLRKTYVAGQVPTGAIVLVCGVDVQKNRLVYVVRAFGHRQESWLVAHGELFGDPEHDAVWSDLSAVLDQDIDGHKVRLTLVDSGFLAERVYSFARQHQARVRATKGHERQGKPIQSSEIDITFRGKVLKRGLKLWHLDTDYFKSWVVQRFDWPDDQPGGWHVCGDADDEYFKQITAEVRVIKPSGSATWLRVRKDNHYLDCEALAAAAAQMLGMHTRKSPASETAYGPIIGSRYEFEKSDFVQSW